MKYRKKPVVIEAIQLNWKNWGKVCDFLGGIISSKSPAREVKDCSNSCGELSPYIEITIPTLEGDHIAKHGDYIIKGVKGEFYPCKPDIFEMTYEKVEESDISLEDLDYLRSAAEQETIERFTTAEIKVDMINNIKDGEDDKDDDKDDEHKEHKEQD